MDQERLSGLAIISVESEVAITMNYNEIIEDFTFRKVRQMNVEIEEIFKIFAKLYSVHAYLFTLYYVSKNM